MHNLVNEWIAGGLDPGITLDLLEAVDDSDDTDLIALVEPHRPKGNTTADFSDALYGGNRRQGARIFFNNPTAQCVRCHSWENEPGSVGPSLAGIADKLTREQLLEAMIEPSARIAPGYGNVSLTLTDGSVASGILMEEKDDELVLKTSAAEPLRVPIKRIEQRENLPSGMPPMGLILERREVRDLVEFLSSLKED
jgi:putative heme-binding domain-containing protein